jgi:hypothetical protein
MGLLPDHKKMIETVLDRQRRDGYKPLRMTLPPMMGCRVCGIKKREVEYVVSVLGHRLESRRIYLWTIATLCPKCRKSEGGKKSKIVKTMLYRWSEGVI